ncbi:MAG TPA: SDR family oxidoreductase [Stellaceae bacterium]|nr:SDR family oxidoreductase [Stellaceae bacterium]
MLDSLRFAGEVAVVTGGGGGIGRACAETLAELGATVAVVGRRAAALDETAALIAAQGGRCECFVADVAAEAEVEALGRAIAAKWGRVKAVINNAGDNFRSKITELETAKWRAIVAVDLDAVFYMCRTFIPLLLQAEKPAILNIASSFGVIGNAEMPAYCAAKGAVVNLTRQLAVDYGPRGLRVNALCPGPTLSPRFRSYLDRGLTSRERLERQVPLNRLAECREIANVAAFLVSDAASFVHGATVMADGGQTVH